LALLLCCWAVTGQASSWPEFSEERTIRWLSSLRLRIDDDVKQGKRTEEEGQLLKGGFTDQITKLEGQVLLLRTWAEQGKADAQRDLIRGKVYIYSIDDVYFPELPCRFGVEQADWNQAREELAGVTVLPVRPLGIDVGLLAARVAGYNEQVWIHLRARHGQDIEKRISARAWQISEQRRHRGRTTERVELFLCFFSTLGAVFLLVRLVELRKRRTRNSTALGAT
jgi:hypothetical protein